MPPCPLYLKDWTCHILLDISAQFSAFVRKRSPSLVAVLVMCQKIESFENSFCHFLSQFNEVSQLYTIYDFQQIKKVVWTYFRDVPRSSLKKWDRDRRSGSLVKLVKKYFAFPFPARRIWSFITIFSWNQFEKNSIPETEVN